MSMTSCLNLILDEEHAVKLSHLTERTHARPDTITRSWRRSLADLVLPPNHSKVVRRKIHACLDPETFPAQPFPAVSRSRAYLNRRTAGSRPVADPVHDGDRPAGGQNPVRLV